jgi:hypothetical protein
MAQALGRVAVIGGGGALGSGLARRWVLAGLDVVIGSRAAERAAATALALSEATGRPVGHGDNATAAAAADLIVVTTPFGAQAQTLAAIRAGAQGKVVLDTTVPLVPGRVMRASLPAEGSAAQRAQALLGEGVKVIAGFHSVAADKLSGGVADCDVLVFGDDKAARALGVELARRAGLRGLHAGALANAAAAEAMTSVLIFINRHYGLADAGLRITGDLREPAIG